MVSVRNNSLSERLRRASVVAVTLAGHLAILSVSLVGIWGLTFETQLMFDSQVPQNFESVVVGAMLVQFAVFTFYSASDSYKALHGGFAGRRDSEPDSSTQHNPDVLSIKQAVRSFARVAEGFRAEISVYASTAVFFVILIFASTGVARLF
jgi:hypothetical protein